MSLSIHNQVIASDLISAGFGVEALPTYNALRVYLSRKVPALVHQVRIALDRAGYEDCQYTLNGTSVGVYVRAQEPK